MFGILSIIGTAQQNTVARGGEISGPGGAMSYSMGQVDYLSITGAGGFINQGVQQTLLPADPCELAIGIVPSIHGEPAWETFDLGDAGIDPGCSGDAEDAIWFSFIAASANDYILAQDPLGGYNVVIEMADACESGITYTCYDNYTSGQIERAIPGALVPGQEYYYRVYDAATGPGASVQVRTQVKTFVDGALNASSCGVTGLQFDDLIIAERDDLGQLYSNPNVPVVGYQFRIQEQGGGLDVIVNQAQFGPGLQMAVIPGLAYGTVYDVSVRHRLQMEANGSSGEFWSGFGAVCAVTMASGPPVTQLNSEFCTATDLDLSDQIRAEPITGATVYEFTFSPGGIVKYSNSYNLNLFTVPGLQYGTVYSVDVRANVNGQWSMAGATCTIGMAPSPEAVAVLGADCDGEYVIDDPNFIRSSQGYGAEEYKWRFTSVPGAVVQEVVTSSVLHRFHTTTATFLPGDYDVEVKVKSGGTYSDYGATCQITMVSETTSIGDPDSEEDDLVIKTLMEGEIQSMIYPNPSKGDHLFLDLSGLDDMNGTAAVRILNMDGSVVFIQEYPIKGEHVRILLDPEADLTSGSYMIAIEVEGHVVNKPLIVQ